MSPVFAGTSFYLALLRAGDASHRRAREMAQINRTILTTECIILELGNACARAADHADFIALVEGLRASSRVTIVPMTGELLSRGLELMAVRVDKDWSLTDCISFLVMGDADIREALTGDQHFEQAGFVALLR